jgi:CubicO group peptidase (beta-lactamase class C family)
MKSLPLSLFTLITLVCLGADAKAAEPEPAALHEFAGAHPFDTFCFTGDQFPACEFSRPERVARLIGPYTLKTTWYDAEGKIVTSPKKGPGRYAAVVEIERPGRVSRRFFTLYHLAGRRLDVYATNTTNLMLPLGAGIDPQLVEKQQDDVDSLVTKALTNAMAKEPEAASFLAGLQELQELRRAGKAAPDDHASFRDRQWWVNFKRKYYGYDKLYPERFVCPRPTEGKPARVIRQGTLAEAGMKSDALDSIDAACAAWVKENGVGFTMCVVRHGVVVINRGYGRSENQPVTPATPGILASTTKFLNAILCMEMVDQGLLRLDDPVDRHVRALNGIAVKRPLTIRDLYMHTGGFTTHERDMLPDLEERIADLYPALEVGVRHHYQGTGHALSAKIMEMKTGEALPYLYQNHLFKPLGCTTTHAELSAFGSSSTALDLARIGQMMLNGGAYGDQRFFKPETLAQMMPVPGKDRIGDDRSIRWGIGIKQLDNDALSDKAFGHSGGSGSFLVIDPERDLVIAHTRLSEGRSFEQFLKQKAKVLAAVTAAIDAGPKR